jgi:ribosome biogenesis GTPase / thiamine phosphate phosphatase
VEHDKLMQRFYEIYSSALPRLGPGDGHSTSKALQFLLEDRQVRSGDDEPSELKVLDIGCGTGAQTLQLARDLDATIIAIDNHQPYLTELRRRLDSLGLGSCVRTLQADMAELDLPRRSFDLIWSEGSAYSMGVRKALLAWRSFLAPGGYLAVSELTWLTPDAPRDCKQFFASEYPAMTDMETNVEMMKACGYEVIETFTLPDSAWWEPYYGPLENRLTEYEERCADDPETIAVIEIGRTEIDMFRRFSEHYGYVFYVLRDVRLEAPGFHNFFREQLEDLDRPDLIPMRVVSEERGNYRLKSVREVAGQLSGRMRHQLDDGDKPVVGDWVGVSQQQGLASIHHVFDRYSFLVRRAAGKGSDAQGIAANVDAFFVVMSADADFNLRRLERYLAAVQESGADAVVILSKIDCTESVELMLDQVESVAIGVPIVGVSAVTGEGMDAVRTYAQSGKTIGLIGSSGVGKSTLVNALLGHESQVTRDVRSDGKGRHTTTRRELIELPNGSFLMDTPGMREFGLADDQGGVGAVFSEITTLAQQCRFRDCEHRGEPGCAVDSAVASGELDEDRLASYHKLQREVQSVELRKDPAHAGRPKKRWKEVSKIIREHKRSGKSKE